MNDKPSPRLNNKSLNHCRTSVPLFILNRRKTRLSCASALCLQQSKSLLLFIIQGHIRFWGHFELMWQRCQKMKSAKRRVIKRAQKNWGKKQIFIKKKPVWLIWMKFWNIFLDMAENVFGKQEAWFCLKLKSFTQIIRWCCDEHSDRRLYS